jgi:signal transduction histidine kinase
MTLVLDQLEAFFGPALLVPYVLVIALAGRWGGLGSAMAACIASIPLIDLYLLEPRGRLDMVARQFMQLILVLVAGLLLGWLLHRLEQARQRAEKHAEAERAALDERDALLRIVAHDLRSPLTAIKARTQLAELALRRDPPDIPSALNSSGTVLPQVDRIARLLDDLQAVGQDGGAFTVQLGPLDLSPLVTRVGERWQTEVNSHRLEIHVAEDLPVMGDENRFEQLLDNLLANAYKYSPHGSTVRLSGWIENGEVRVSVHDDGPGIPVDERERIFERFYRRPVDREARRPGLGLGLYIARELAIAHGARLWVSNGDVQKGSTFVVSLPHRPGSGR